MDLKQKTAIGVFWSGIERFSVQGIMFIVQVILARLLLPSDYGLIGMLVIFIAVSQSFIDSGFSNALIRKQDRTETDFSTVFYFNIIVGILFYLLLFLSSSFIAVFFKAPILEILIKVLALTLFLDSFSVIQRTIFTIEVDFKTLAKASLISVIISGIVAIWLAYSGYGVWSLVIQSVLNSTINMLMLWVFSKWKPLFVFSWMSFEVLFSYGSKILLSGLIDTVYKNLYTLVIGKKFNAYDLGYYTRADQFSQFPSLNISVIISRVTFPLLSSIQNDNERLRIIYSKYLKLSAFIIFPLMTGLAAVASPLINLLLTPKWNGAVVLLQILCFSYMWYPIHSINLNLLQVKGRSDLYLKLEIYKKIIGVSILFFSIPFGIEVMCAGTILSSVIFLIINTHYTGKFINVSLFKQIQDLLPMFLCSMSMCIIIWFSIKIVSLDSLKLLLGLLVGLIYYFSITYITKSPELLELLSLIKKTKNGRK